MRRFIAVLLGVGALLSVPAPLHAGMLSISPTRVDVRPRDRIGTVTVTNIGDEAVSARVYGQSWRQVDGVDVKAATTDLIASPPIFTVAPGKSQLIRIGRRSGLTGNAAYRLIVEEIPAAEGSDVRIAIRLDLPLFFLPDRTPEAPLVWTIRRSGSQLALQAANPGLLPVQVRSIGLLQAGARKTLSEAAATVIPGGSHAWMLPTTALPAAGTARLGVRTDLGEREAQIDLATR